jgi:predicted Zn-dependent protease
MNSLFKISSVAVIALFVTTGAPLSFAQFGDLTKKNPLAKPEKQEEDKKDNDKTAANIGGAVGLISTATSSQSVEEEIAAGDAVAAMYLGASPLLKNKRAQSYVNAIGKRIADKSSRPDLPWSFGILDTPSINAFAAPGGKVLITAGLFDLLETEDELAAVLGHEVAHVARQHHWELIKQQKLISGATDMVATNTESDNALANAAFDAMSDFFKQMINSGIDKGGEYEADSDGVILAANAGYDSTAMLGVLEKLANASESGNDVSFLFQTHPSAEDRVNNVVMAFTPDLENAAVPSTHSARIQGFQSD